MKRLIKSALIVSLSILASRVLGLVRDVVIATYFGAGTLTDTFFVAFRIPNLLRRIFAEGAFNSAFVPALKKKLKNSFREAVIFSSQMLTVLTLLLLITLAVGELLSPYIVKLVAPGFKGENFHLAVRLLRELLPYIFLVSLVAFFGGILNSLEHFFAPAFSTALFNLAIILSALLLHRELSIESLSVGVILGGVLQLTLQLLFLKKLRFPVKFTFSLSEEVVKTLKNTVPGIFGFAVRQFSMLIDTVIASFLHSGAISYLYYANRFVQLPLGMFAIGLSQVLLPRFSAKESSRELKKELSDSITLCSSIIVPSAVGLITFGMPIVDLIFKHGSFTGKDLEGTYAVLVGYTLGLFFFSLEKVIVNAFYSLEEFKLPVKISAATLGLNLLLSLFFCFVLKLKALGLALGTSLTSFANLTLLSYYLSERLGGNLNREIWKKGVKYLLLSLPITLITYPSVKAYFTLSSIYLKSTLVVLVIALSGALYFLLLYLTKDEVYKGLFGKEV
ncbi:murein biosynthesis integral membrane protein MurJ [Thermovibrio sp.]